MQAPSSEDFTDVLIDLIGTEDDERSDQSTFNALHPSFSSALVRAQSSGRPPAATAGSSSASSSIRDGSGRFDFDRIREELSRSSTPKSHSDVSALSWTRSNSLQGEAEGSSTGRIRSTGTLGSTLSEPTLSRTPASVASLDQDSSGRVASALNPRDDHTLTLLSPLKLDHAPLSGSSVSPGPPQTLRVPEHVQESTEPSTRATWQNMTELFDLMQAQMASLSRSLELARVDSAALRNRCMELESRLGIRDDASIAPTSEPVVSPNQRSDNVRPMTPPADFDSKRPETAPMDSALTFIRNIDELVWRRTLFANSPVELAVLASLPDFVRNNDDILTPANLTALEERIRLWESIVRRTPD